MNKRLYQILEFDAVLEDLAGRAHCSVSAQELRELTPLSGVETVKQRLAEISELRAFMDDGGSFPMGSFEDLRNDFHSATVAGSHLELEAFRRIHRVLTLSKILFRFFQEHDGTFPAVSQVATGLGVYRDLTGEVERTIDLSSLEMHDKASPALGRLRRQLTDARHQIQRQLQRLTDSLGKRGILQEQLVTVRSGRWVLPVKETHRHMVKGVLHDRSASGATAFLEPLETLELNNRIRQIESEERQEIERILIALTDAVRERLPELERVFQSLVALDGLYAKALASKAFHQNEPAITSHSRLHLTQARHPLLILRRAAVRDVVPLTLSMGKEWTTLVITGPNAGGKTVALKTLGLLALMVSCGLHIPAGGDSEIPLFRNIFAHVGDDQSIENDLSTFSAHLNGLRNLLDEAGPEDLVLIDEIGAGTDPQEGSALAMAVLEYLTERGTLTVVTSHHGALKAFAHDTPGVANGSMAFDGETLTPTYVFRPDLPGSSYAFEIAKRIGLKATVVDRARHFMDTQTNRLEDLLMELERQIRHTEDRAQELDRETDRVRTTRQDLAAKQDELLRNEKALRKTAAEKASAVLAKANRAVEEAVSAVRREQASQASIRAATASIEAEKAAVEKERRLTAENDDGGGIDGGPEMLKAGDAVRWKRGGKYGIVVIPPEADDRTLVAFGAMKVHVPRAELQRRTTPEPEREKGAFVGRQPDVDAQSQVDVRGMHVEEALERVDKFLDNAILSGLTEVEIIHGVGTGALRNNLIPYLTQHPYVETTSHGPPNRENPGMTIVRIGNPVNRR